MRLLRNFWGDERGATVVEYGLIAAVMATFILFSFTNLLNAVIGVFTRVQTVFLGST